MTRLVKTFIVALVSSVTFAFGAAPAMADAPIDEFQVQVEAAAQVTTVSQTLATDQQAAAAESVLTVAEGTAAPHGFDVERTIALAESEVGTSRATGWSQPGECIMSAQRWVRAGGGNWKSGGNPVTNYDGATRLSLADAEPGDIVQYENIASPTSWVTGVHTVLITEVHDDGTFTIIESNNPGGSGLVSKDENWKPKPPEGFQAVVWRF